VARSTYDPKVSYLWRIEADDQELRIVAQDEGGRARFYFIDRIVQTLFVAVGFAMVGFVVVVPFLIEDWADLAWLMILFGAMGCWIAVTFAYNLWKTPFVPLRLCFDTASQTLEVTGQSWRGQSQTQTLTFADIKQVFAFTSMGSWLIRHHMIRIDILKPHQYFVIRTQQGDLQEAQYYLKHLRLVLPDKIRDELGGAKLWVDP
jgi:hypothetical protein